MENFHDENGILGHSFEKRKYIKENLQVAENQGGGEKPTLLEKLFSWENSQIAYQKAARIKRGYRLELLLNDTSPVISNPRCKGTGASSDKYCFINHSPVPLLIGAIILIAGILKPKII